MRLLRGVVAVAVLAAGFALGIELPAHAVEITVNTATDPAPIGGNFNNDDDLCSLRAAIQAAQNNTNAHDTDCSTGVAGALDTIVIDPLLAGQTMTMTYVAPFTTITGPTNPVKIIGPTTNPADFVIDANYGVRPFLLGAISSPSSAADLELANVTVKRGNGQGGGGIPNGFGGAVYMANSSHLTLDNVVLRENRVTDGVARGGAIYGIAANVTNNGGAYISNTAGQGGAAFFEEGGPTESVPRLSGYAVKFESNSATSVGGVIATNSPTTNPFVHIERSLMLNNSAGSGGASMYVLGGGLSPPPDGTVFELTDSTVYNQATLFTAADSSQGFRFLRDTFVKVTQLFSAGIGYAGNSIIVGTSPPPHNASTPVTCANTRDASRFTGTRNLLTDTYSCGFFNASQLGGVTGLSPTLAQNGGPEVQQTFALSSGSNAIDNGSSSICGTIDARSVSRGVDGNGIPNNPQAGDCDIGAYEYVRYVVNFVTGTSTASEPNPAPAGPHNVQVRLKIADPADSPTTAPITVTVGADPASTAKLGEDFTVANGGATFPVGSVDGAVANVGVNILDDDVEERVGEQAVLLLTGGTNGTAVAEPKTHSVVIEDDDNAGINVTGPTGRAATEANVAVGPSINVALSSRPGPSFDPANPTVEGPPADVEVRAEPDRDCTILDEDGHVGSLGQPVTFTIRNADWRSGTDLRIRAVDDPWDEDLRDEQAPHNCEIRFSFDSADPVYANTQRDFDVPIFDNDVAGVILHRSDPPVLAEGAAKVDHFTLRLKTPPDPGKPLPGVPRGPTTIQVSPGAQCDAGEGPGVPHALAFTDTDWDQPQAVDVRPAQDQTVELRHGCDVALSLTSPDPVYADLDSTLPTLHDRIDDYALPSVKDDPPFVDIAADGIAVEEGQPVIDSFTVQLRRAPTDDVTVTLKAPVVPANGGPQALIYRGSDAPSDTVPLTFTLSNWDTPVTVHVVANDDPFDEAAVHPGRIDVTIASSAPGFSSSGLRKVVVDGVASGNRGVIGVNVTDNDTASVVFAPAASTEIYEGGAGDTFSVSLASRPRRSVTVRLSPGEDCALDRGTIKFAPEAWNTPVVVNVSAVDDDIEEAIPEQCAIRSRTASKDRLYRRIRQTYNVNVIDNDAVDLSLTKVATVSQAPVGANFGYVINVRNRGGTAVNTRVTDGLPDQLTYVSNDAGCTGSSLSPKVSCSLGDLAPGASRTIRIVVHAATSGLASNTATVGSDTTDLSPGNNSGTADVFVTPTATPASSNISVTKTGPTEPVLLGSTFDYVVVVGNLGGDPAVGVTMIDNLPSEVVYVSDDGGCTGAPNLRCNIGTMVSRATRTITITVRAREVGDSTNLASAQSPFNDPVLTNNTDGADVTIVPGAAIANAKSREGNSGQKDLVFRVQLSAPALGGESVDYATAPGSAGASDFEAATGTLTFSAGQEFGEITVKINGDRSSERNERFTVQLSNPNGLVITDGEAIGVIVNDDG